MLWPGCDDQPSWSTPFDGGRNGTTFHWVVTPPSVYCTGVQQLKGKPNLTFRHLMGSSLQSSKEPLWQFSPRFNHLIWSDYSLAHAFIGSYTAKSLPANKPLAAAQHVGLTVTPKLERWHGNTPAMHVPGPPTSPRPSVTSRCQPSWHQKGGKKLSAYLEVTKACFSPLEAAFDPG